MSKLVLPASLRLACGALVLGALALTAGACLGKKVNNGDENPDGGPSIQTCEDASDCSADAPACSFGVCKRPCAANDACIDPSTFCNTTTQYCEPGCRDSTSCPDGQVCSAGACITSTGCATKCDCAAGQVCTAGVCQAPPATCRSADDCGKAPGDQCDDFQCNGFTQLCFDPDPDRCESAQDCTGRPGCTDGCACTGNGQCVPDVSCTAANESTTCGAGNYCDGNGTCQPLPSCTVDADCGDDGLVCNLGTGQCRRTQPCTTSANCMAPTSFCDDGFCAQPLCTNGGVTCSATQTCAPDGRCVTQGQGGACASDAQCDADEYCAIVNGSGQCAVGCRNNASCPQGQVCNGSRTCVASGGSGGSLGGFGASCTADEECQAGLICGTITGTCAEPCDVPDETCSGGGCCPLSGAGCCNAFLGIFAFCGDCP